MSIAAVSNLGLSGSYGAAAAPVAASSVRSTSDGIVMETLGRLKVSEIDGKNVTSMYSSGAGEGEVLSSVKLGGGNAPQQAPAPDLYPNEVQDAPSGPAVQQLGGGNAAPAPTSIPTAAATVAYQAVSSFGGGAVSTFSASA